MKLLALAFGIFGVIIVAGVSASGVYFRRDYSSATHKPSIASDAVTQAEAGKPVAAPAASGSGSLGAAVSDDCLQSDFEINRANAQIRVVACSAAIQSKKLDKDQLARARLNRGIARMAIGDMTMAANDYEEALKHYDSAIDSQAPDAWNLYRRGLALDGLGQTDRALTDFDAAIRLDPSDAIFHYRRGVVLATRKRALERAIEDFDKVLMLVPDNLDALIRRGQAYGQLGDNGHSLADLDRAVLLAPRSAQARLFRGLTHNRRGEAQLAVEDYGAAIALDPRSADALINRSAVFAALGKDDLAHVDLEAAILLQPKDPYAHYNLGDVHFAKREYDEAIRNYSAAIRLDPGFALAYNNRCLTRSIVGHDLIAALDDCDTALKLAPYNLDIRDTRGFTYLKLGDPAIAIVEYDAALALDPNRALSLFGRGMARIRMGHRNEGAADQAAARVLSPSVERAFSIYGLN